MVSKSWKRPSFATKIITAFVLVILLTQVATLAIVDFTVDRNVHRQLGERLEFGKRVWAQLSGARAEQLGRAVNALATDFAFREALATGDASTALSVLDNHSRRIGTDVALLFDLQGNLLTSTLEEDEAEQQANAAPLLEDARTKGQAAGVIVLGGRPHELALVPVMAPTLIGWVAMGRPLGESQARAFHALTGLDLALATRSAGGRWQLQGSSLADDGASALVELSHEPAAGTPVTIGAKHFYFQHLDAGGQAGSPVRAWLMADIDAALQPYQRLKRQILMLATAAAIIALLVAVLVGRGVTRPVARLAKAARRVGDGDYAEPLPVVGSDELSALAGAFNQMQDGIAQREAQIRHQAHHDHLTGLPNRAHALAELERQVAVARDLGATCAVLMLDLDRFKEVNDTLGHGFGDDVLGMVASRLRHAIRNEDVLARLGGDEFVVLMQGMSEQAAFERACKLVDGLRDPLDLGLGKPQVSVDASAGLAVYPTHGDTPDVLLRRADIAMYEAKQGRRRVAVYSAGHDELHLRQIRLISDLRHAHERGELHLVFQPKIALATDRVVHAEALLRWRHPELGMVGPDEFIPLAERAGLIHAISEFVFDRALGENAAWRQRGIAIGIAINLSALDLVDVGLPARVEALLAKHAVPHRDLIIEITETTVMRDLQVSLQTMHQLQRLGVRLSIDDFGTGHSSLAQLRSLPVDEIKIDKSFVMQLVDRPEDTAIVRSAIELGHNMGLTVIAEGVEESGSLAILRELNCDMVQGYFYSRPIESDAFCDWVDGYDGNIDKSDAQALTCA